MRNIFSKTLIGLAFCSLFLGSGNIARAASDETSEFFVDGLKVILSPSPKEVISVRLVVKGGTSNYSDALQGVENMAFSMAMQGGTESKDKIAFKTAAEKIGTTFYSSANLDYGDMGMTCIDMFWNESWDLFTEAVMMPAFDESEFELMRKQMIAGAQNSEQDPDTHLRHLASQFAFKGTSYERIPEGTAESLTNMNLNDVKAYYDRVVGKKNCFLIVVGDITAKDLKAKIQSTLAKMKMGTATVAEKRKMIAEPGVFVENRDIATNYIRGIMSAPTQDQPDAVSMRLAMSILRDRYFEELRTKRSLTYAPGAFYSSGVINNPYNVLYVSTQKPVESMRVMIDEVNKIKKEGFTQKELTDQKQTFLTYNYMGLETSASQSQNLAMAELAGDWKLAGKFTDWVNRSTLKDLNRVFDTYTNVIKWIYLGKQEQVTDADFAEPEQSPAANKPY